jgi:methylated-DNA-[protein]-cysteine S-methyltransferase
MKRRKTSGDITRRHHTVMKSPVGDLLLIDDDGQLAALEFDDDGSRRARLPSAARAETALLQETRQQLEAYFAGELLQFDLPLMPVGTAFQQRVWKALGDIPYGQTISYAELARRVESPKACRAVGSANGSNPSALIIPCHRVIATGGGLGGYGGGLDRKRWLLELESGNGEESRPVQFEVAGLER